MSQKLFFISLKPAKIRYINLIPNTLSFVTGYFDNACKNAALSKQKQKKPCEIYHKTFYGNTVIGVTGFEPAASWSRTKHSTGLSHTPIACILYHNAAGLSIAFAKKLAFP